MKRKKIVSLVSMVAVIVVLLSTFVALAHPGHFKQLKRIAGIYVKSTPPKDWRFPRRGAGTGTPSVHAKGGTPGSGHGTPRPGTPNPSGMPYVQGDQVFDGAGHPLVLRGAQIESAFAYIGSWRAGGRLSNILKPTVFNAMQQQWKMNTLRLPLSNWIYAQDPARFLNELDTVVQQANAAGLYVVLDLHDNGKAGSPYGDNADLPKAENIPFWKAIAGHYKGNPMVMFDVFNEPKATNWSMWLHGGGTVGGAKVVGFQDLIDAVRSTGAKQIIIVEPGAAGGNSRGWSTFANTTINDANILYSLHVYDHIGDSPQQDDALWGPILYHHPIFYGEWALLPNGYGTAGYDHCKSIVPSQADQIVQNFLTYMNSRHANWAAWQFTPYHLITNYNNFAPTTLDMPWTCGDPNGQAGMGTIVKRFMLNN